MKTYLFSFLMLLVAWPSSAEGRMEFYTDVFGVVRDKLIPRIVDQLPRDERRILASIDLKMIPNPAIVSAVFTVKETRQIYMFVGFVDGMFQYVDCLLMHGNGQGPKECYSYFEYYFDHIVLKKRNAPVTYAEFILIDDKKVEAWYSDHRIDAARKQMLLGGLITVVMHEMGHHIVGFADSSMNVAQHRRLEARVDQWATNRLAQMDHNPVLGAVVAFGYVSQMERFRRLKGARVFSIHPAPRERADYAHRRGCANASGEGQLRACRMLADTINAFE